MKNRILFFIIILFAAGCSGEKNRPDAYGTFEATETVISSLSNGKILWLKLEEGQILDSGQVVGVIDTVDLSLKKSQAKEVKEATAARINDLQAQIAVQEQVRKNLLVDKTRLEKMFKEGAATQKQMDDLNGNLDLVEKQIASLRSQFTGLNAQVAGNEKQVEQIHKSIHDASIVNPLKGTVLAKYAEPDEVATYGKPLYKIADLSELELRVYVSGTQLPYIKLGQQVNVQYDRNEKSNFSTTGTIIWISETAEFTPKTIQTKEERVNLVYAVKVKVKNDGSLKIGMPGEIRFMNVNKDK
ncbi:MAG: HlyD family efflux transporter periplasmic adaptor subunit [Bacteroidota bacterium]|nr:HlyD family efflux transporter periplasmic adaptor subunit [Bacteroidota bacterium]